MFDCVYSPHCIRLQCDESCPVHAESSYLLERNNIDSTSSVFNQSSERVARTRKLIEDSVNKLTVIESSNTVSSSDFITYCACALTWKGCRLHCTAYNLRLSKYLDDLRNSWNSGNTDKVDYIKVWAETAKILVVSNIDYVKFKDFESQILLNLLQTRTDKCTIIVSPQIDSLVGDGLFFSKLKNMMKGAIAR